jgi:hypothetical protein
MIREIVVGLVQIGTCTGFGVMAGIAFAFVTELIWPPRNAEERQGNAFGMFFATCLFGFLGFLFGIVSLAKGW